MLEVVNRYHRVPATLTKVPAGRKVVFRRTPETRILLAPYPANQIYLSQYSNRDENYDSSLESFRQMYNEYFGSGMNSIVFQEMRESRGLAYFAWANMFEPDKLEYPYFFLTQLATQNDKMIDAIRTFNQIIDSIPLSETAFCLAKEALLARLRTERIVKEDVLWKYVYAQDLGENTDPRIRLFDEVPRMTLQDVVDYQKKWVKGRPFVYCILGDKSQLDMEKLKEVGPVEELTQEQIFGY